MRALHLTSKKYNKTPLCSILFYEWILVKNTGIWPNSHTAREEIKKVPSQSPECEEMMELSGKRWYNLWSQKDSFITAGRESPIRVASHFIFLWLWSFQVQWNFPDPRFSISGITPQDSWCFMACPARTHICNLVSPRCFGSHTCFHVSYAYTSH